MTRSRAGRKGKNTQENSSASSIPDAFLIRFAHIRSVYTTTLHSSSLPRTYNEWKIHPNYGFPDNGSINSSYGLNSLIGSSTTGLYISQKIRKVKVTIDIQNLDTLAKTVAILPIPYASTGVSVTNILMDNPHAKTWFLAPKGSGGDTKRLTFVVEPYKIEGLKSFDIYSAIQNYWCTNTTVGAQYSVVGFGVQSIDDSTSLTNGVSLTTVVESWSEVSQNNQKLSV